MDISALRLAALSSKRQRKQEEDVEEGEIDPNSPSQTTTRTEVSPALSSTSTSEQQSTRQPSPPLHSLVTATPASRPFSPPPAHATAAHPVLAIKEESKGIIAQLLSYGVTPDYLISVGVSRDIIDISFHELGLAPPPFGPPPPPAVNPNFNRGAPPPPPPGIDPRHVGSEPLRNTSPPPANLLTPTPAPPPLDPELALVEARKRQELLARKALTIARNKAKARSLESELDSLFASATWAARAVKKEDDGDVVMLDDEFEEGEVEPEVEVVDDDADVGALRGSLAHTEETVTGPLAGPFGATAAETGDGRRRPVAVDFEAEPTISLPPSHTSRPGPSYITDMPSKMVIDLSESEGEDDDEDDELSRGVKLERAPSMQQESSGDGGEEADSAAKRQLEEKELEIKRIMERIAQMEKKTKGRGTPSRQSSVPAASTAATAAETTPRLSPPPMALEEAREHVQLLEAERSTLAAVVGEEEEGTPALEVVMDVEESLGGGDEDAPAETAAAAAADASTTEDQSSFATAAQSGSITSSYKPYESSLARFPLCRQHAAVSASSPFPSLPSSSLSSPLPPPPSTAGIAGLATFVAHKRGIDTSKRVCRAETSGGRCHDSSCKSLHVGDFLAATEDDRAQFARLAAGNPATASASSTSQ